MGYFKSYKNTFAVDLLEFFKVVKLDENFSDFNSNSTINRNAASTFVIEQNKVDLEATVDVDSCKSNESSNGSTDDSTGNIKLEEKDDPYLVGWNGPEDPDNPQNWSTLKKTIVIFNVMLLTAVTYMGSSIYTPGEEQIRKEFHVGHVVATLNLSLYVLGYGLGPIVFSPLTEIAKIGRQQTYTLTFFCFTILQIGAATVHNIGGLIVIRFFTGIFCSPALATGAATIADVVSPEIVPIFLAIWSIGAMVAPIIGPLLGATMVISKGWRWIFWLLLWMSAATLIILTFFFPETSANNILSRRASRIRNKTGDKSYYTVQEKLDSDTTTERFLINTFYRPFKLIAKEPMILVLDVYLALCYGAFYLFFEAFPIVFVGIYHFTLIETGLAYFGFCVGCCIAFPALMVFLHKVVRPRFENNTFTPEVFLILAMCVSWSLPTSLFLFGWAASTHWIVPIIAQIFFVLCVFNLFQCTFSYLAMAYPKYTASVFAGNSLFRASFACAFPLFGQAMYNNLAIDGYPVGWGSSLIGFFCMALAATPFVLYKYGPALRARSAYSD
ncbi:Flr1p NDAI_0A07730 [Naumovozyma dairenensis CBS 421]|uniref:Major facilitator superfamily (MFS) profile domain-containing protein n=1 Tax=Naumovozyma dairenensis (strain ATCC 10597 / BCRC 20456 / CBS 421 / NBRC 0211 / NRRL Y-12639) TaxID=1071378 RepID=G0W539_NAUDC|nr:hypothetical protein NDAI_0A07730 [Naumovozyma dairenensis CBS 421]CCD22927.1 hypothetical protein NDAI_0A07730 [Naumovozyma dairenensis CBS 421]